MNLYILRHGLAVDHGTKGYEHDADRPLTSKGERKLGLVADALQELELEFDLILSSPFVRARETAEIIAEELGLRKKLEFTKELEPGGNVKDLIMQIKSRKAHPEEVMLVGHEPYLSSLISLLISGNTNTPILMKKGGLCKLSTDSLAHGRCATLEWLLTPRQMGLMG